MTSHTLPEVDADFTPSFREQRALDNVSRLRVLARVYLGVVLWFAAVNLAFVSAGKRDFSGAPYYIVLYSMFSGINVYTLVRIRRMTKGGTAGSYDVAYHERLISRYVFEIMLIGALISLADQALYGHVMVYGLTLLLTAAFLLTDAKQVAAPILVSALLLLISLPFRLPPGRHLMHVYQELLAYIPIAFLVSRLLHRAYMDSWRSKVSLERTLAENRLLNTKLQEMNARLETLAETDEVTGIANRRGLHAYSDALLSAATGSVQLAVIMIDIDCFKGYNDLHGHDRGDEILSLVAQVLVDVARKHSGFIARWGGEEFVYITAQRGKEEILEICRIIRETIGAQAIPHGGSIVAEHVTLSQGACVMEVRTREDFECCIRRADRALYVTKASGRDGFTFCDAVVV